MRAGKLAEALIFAERAVEGECKCIPAHGLLATVLLQLGRAADAETVIVQSLRYKQGSADAYDALAHVSMLLGQHERSNALYRRVVKLEPGDPRFWYNFASSERSFGRLLEAESACNQAIALDPTLYASYLLRSELRVQSREANHIEELQSQLARRHLDERARVVLGYALAKELDDLQRFDEAFRWFSEAASTRRRHLAYDVGVDERKLQRIKQNFPRSDATSARESDDQSDRYIFIVGLPRSGTTLVERILTGLPGVRSNGETDYFSRSLMAALPPEGSSDHEPSMDVIQRAASADPAEVAARYSNLASRGRVQGDRIVEKLPLNYLYLGAIHRALPQAKLLIVRRSPLDSCFAMYRTLFGAAYPFSYDFDDLARYYAAYDRLIAHWRAVLGEKLQEVTYEELIKNPLRVGTTIAAACGLPWTDSAIEIQKNASVSLTASAAQIRRPIYGSSSGRWRYYRKHLEPLVDALRRRAGIPLPDDAR
jgi:tetratricopeptide (TPR) repeat protein